MERLKKFNIGLGYASKFHSVLGGVKRKAVWVGHVACQVPGCPYQSGFLDKVTSFPHHPTCPRGHVQEDATGQPVTMESEEAQEIARWGLYRDIAAGGELGARATVSRSDNLIDPLEFFNQGVNQSTVEDKILAKRLKGLR